MQPAEWSPQSAVWTAWPHIEDWGDNLSPAREEVAGMIRILAAQQPVRVVVNSKEDGAEVLRRFPKLPVSCSQMRFGDIWMRDIGPVFVKRPDGTLGASCFTFNGWGGKYIFDGDDAVGTTVAQIAGVGGLTFSTTTVLEGGALEVDGEGTCLTTRQCALNANRNPGITEADVEHIIHGMLGAEKTLWIDEGLANDHTDGHIDTLVRFVAPGVVVCMESAGSDDPNAKVLGDILTAVRQMRDAKGRKLEVFTVPSPGRVTLDDGTVMPASYANFLIANGVVIVPTYGANADDAAVAKLAELFHGRTVVGAPSKWILTGGGAFHCITQQQPVGDIAEGTKA